MVQQVMQYFARCYARPTIPPIPKPDHCQCEGE